MSQIYTRFILRGISALLTATFLPGVLLGQGIAIPKLNLEAANVAAMGNEIHLKQVLFKQNGEEKMVDVIVTLRPSQGEIVVHKVTSERSEPTLNRGENFVPGTYADLAGNKYSVVGGAYLNGGRLAWSMRSITGGLDFDVSWATGPLEGNPVTNYSRASLEGVSFGIVGLSALTDQTGEHMLFYTGHPIAAAQIGDSIVLYRLSNHLGTQSHKPNFQLQFRRVAD